MKQKTDTLKFVKRLEAGGLDRTAAEAIVEGTAEFMLDQLTTKEDLEKLETRLDRVETSLRGEIAELGSSVRHEMSEMGSSIRHDMAEMGSSIRQDMAEMSALHQQDLVKVDSSLRQAITNSESSIRQDMAEQSVSLARHIYINSMATITVLFAFLRLTGTS